ncbi:phage tail tip protein [Escherichia coli]
MGKGGGRAHTPREAKDNLKSTQMMSVIDAIGEGPIEGPVKGLQSILVNKTPLTDTDGNPVIHGVTAVWRAGEQEQTPPEGFESSGAETALGVEVTKAKPVTRTITSANIDRLRVTFGVQSLLETTSKGDRNPSSVRLLIQLQRNGNWVTEKDVTINGKTTSQYLASVILENLPERPFNIRMVRETADSTSDQLQNKTLWSSYTEIIDVKQCYLAQAKWDTPRVVKGVRFSLRLTSGSGQDSRLVTTAITADTEHRFSGLPPGEYTLTVRAINSYGQQGEPATTTFRINAPAKPATIELTPGYFQITAVPRLAVYDPTVQFEFWFSETKIADISQVETSARYLGTGSQWSVSGPHIKPGKDFWFYVRSVNLVGKSAFVEVSGQPSNDGEGYLEFFREKIGKLHLAQGLWELIDNSQLADEMAEMKTTITETRNEITQTVSKTLEDQSATIQQIQRVQKDTNDDLAALYMLKVQKTKNGIPYVAGIGAGIEDTDGQPLSNILLLADRIAMINPEDGNTTPLFVAQGNQLFMNDVFLKRLFAVSITSSGNPPTFSLTPEGKLTARNADISGAITANTGTLNNVTINENCVIRGKLSANQIEGDLVKTVGKAFPRDSRAPERWPSGTITVRVYDDQPFDRQIVIPAVAFSGAKHEREHTDIYSSCRLIVRKNGAEIYNRTALDNTLIYSGVIDMPAGHGHMTLEFSVSAWLVNNWYPTASISDLLVVVMKKSTAGISIS